MLIIDVMSLQIKTFLILKTYSYFSHLAKGFIAYTNYLQCKLTLQYVGIC